MRHLIILPIVILIGALNACKTSGPNSSAQKAVQVQQFTCSCASEWSCESGTPPRGKVSSEGVIVSINSEDDTKKLCDANLASQLTSFCGSKKVEYSNKNYDCKVEYVDPGQNGGGGSPAAEMRFITVQGRDFAMQETETTRGQWKAVMGTYPEELRGWEACSLEVNEVNIVSEDSHPVSCVSWDDANEFASNMNGKHDGYNYRLPTEEEWSYAAGNIGGSTFGWCDTTSIQPVGKLKANNGLYDMVGNVSEWTSTSTNSGFSWVIRGNSWKSGAQKCSSAFRFYFNPHHRFLSLGFRLVRTKSSP